MTEPKEAKEKLQQLADNLEAQAGGNIWNVQIQTEITERANKDPALLIKIQDGTTSGISSLLRDLYRREKTRTGERTEYLVSAVKRRTMDQPTKVIISHKTDTQN